MCPNSVEEKYVFWPYEKSTVFNIVLPQASSRVILMILDFCFMLSVEAITLEVKATEQKSTERIIPVVTQSN